MARGNQRDKAREKNLKAQAGQVSFSARIMSTQHSTPNALDTPDNDLSIPPEYE